MGWIERLKGDFTFLKGALRALRMTTPIAKNPTRVFPIVVEELAEKFGDAPALLSSRERLSYRELAERSNRYARWARGQGLAKGETVCLLMPNRPEYMAIWLGITRAGGIVALLNTNLTGASLAHCINIVEPKHVIVAAELVPAFATARTQLVTNAKIWGHAARRPHVRRAADVSHQRRRCGSGRDAGPRRIGGVPREILRARILGRRRRLGLHAVLLHRRAVPLSDQLPGKPQRDEAQDPAVLRQR